MRRDENGLFVYSLILYSDIKKSAKSTIAAAVSLWLAWHTPWETVRVVANDLRQADSRTFFYIERAIMGNPRLRSLCKIKRYHIELPNHTTIEAIPVDPSGEAGGGDLITCFTELWAFKNIAAKKLWSETTLSPLKYGQSLRWCESYAGFDGQSPILEQLYKAGVTEGELIDVGIEGLELYINPLGRMLTLWNTVPRCSWQTVDYYAQESASLTPEEFNRMHRNQWQKPAEAFIPMPWWDACQRTLPAQTSKPNVVIGMDAAVSGDCFAIIVLAKVDGILTVIQTHIWTPPKNGHIDFSRPEAVIRRLANECYVYEVAYDPYQLEDMTQRLRLSGINCRAFNQGVDRLVGDKRLYDGIREHRIAHDGNPELREHVQNANRKEEGDSKLRIIKRNESAKIDGAVALAMAYHRASLLNL